MGRGLRDGGVKGAGHSGDNGNMKKDGIKLNSECW